MPWEQPDDRLGRTAVFLLVAAILVAAALAIALVAGAASQESPPAGDVFERGAGVTDGTSTTGPVRVPVNAAPTAYRDFVITGHRITSAGTFEHTGELSVHLGAMGI